MQVEKSMTDRSPVRGGRSPSLAAMRWVAPVLGLLTLAGPAMADWNVAGYLAARAVAAEGRASWLGGGFGSTGPGPLADGDETVFGEGQLHVTAEGRFGRRWRFFGHLTGRTVAGELDSGDIAGRDLGVVEAYLEGLFPLAGDRRLRFQLGHFLLPTSLENVEVGWSSPYTQSFSAINTWVGEEVRPTGVLFELNQALEDRDSLRLGGAVFGGNDSSGTLLAWRGWVLGDRLTVWDEVLPLPPLQGLRPGLGFEEQRAEGSRPFGSDLDDQIGWAGWARWSRHDRALVQWTRYENGGDRRLHGAFGDREYAWDTTFDLVATQLEGGGWTLAGEWMAGDSFMGFAPDSRVEIDFDAYYALVSRQFGAWRTSLRYDDFEVVDRDPISYDQSDQQGRAWTVALFYEPSPSLRLGLEWLEVDSERPEAALSSPESLFGTDTGGRRLQLELRWYFGL